MQSYLQITGYSFAQRCEYICIEIQICIEMHLQQSRNIRIHIYISKLFQIHLRRNTSIFQKYCICFCLDTSIC